ncbi:unnamed protein product [Rotaria sp. Silwood2]|nr:unnamed protein product [Rotaria sp. Silwood2]CAF4535483.1 unnamed protein product [Rotaria sp. Silwood2]
MPQTPYAVSKFEGELYCKLFSDLYSVSTVRLRFFMVFGPNEPSQGTYAIVTGIFRKQKERGQTLTIHGDGSQTRDFIHVYDISDALMKAMQMTELTNHTINVGTGEEISIKRIADMIDPINQVYQPPRPVDLKRTCADTSKMLQLLNFKPIKQILPYLNQEYSSSFRFNQLQIVIARQSNDDDLSWSNSLSEYRLVYSSKGLKDLPLPHVQLENQGDIYLQHIARLYPDFPNYTIFCSGDLRDCDTAKYVTAQCQKLLEMEDESEIKDLINLSNNPDVMVFAIHKNRIRLYKKSFYEQRLAKDHINLDFSQWELIFHLSK